MSDDEQTPRVDDPFLIDDAAAREREKRRLEREAKRQGRSGRRSLGSRVSSVLDGSTSDPVKDPPPDDPNRVPADVLMPRRPSRAAPGTGEVEAAPATPPAPPSPPANPVTEDHDWFADPDPADIAAPPPPITADRPAAGTGDYPPLPPPSEPPAGARRGIMLRRIAALAVVVILALAAYVVISGRGNDQAAPVPKGPKTLKTEDVTIPEGYTRSQIAEVAKKAGLEGDYEKETASAPTGFDLKKLGAPGGASLEGFLFPATYNLEKGANVSALVKDQLVAFNQNIAEVDLKAAEKKNLTTYDVAIIASMIEREVLVPEERPLVAAVIYNRLSQGIPLGIDATLRYALDNFDKPLTASDLATDSPYNTRDNQGLPPTPIANPGLDSLKAAANPSNDNYLYYVGKYGTCGEHFFTDDYDKFLAASDEYNAALEAQGGPPTEC